MAGPQRYPQELEGTDYRMSRVRLATVGKVLFGLALGLQFGCGGVFLNRPIAYEDARETAPLEVPAGLLTPAANPALQIPSVSGVAANLDSTPPTLGSTVAGARASLPRAANAVLTLEDEAASTWRRVGIALTRSDCCKVLSKDESDLSYQVELSAGAPRPGFFKRIFGAGSAPATMTIQVVAAAEGSSVSVVDESGDIRRDDPAMTVLGVVEARLR